MRADALARCEAEESAASIRCFGGFGFPDVLRADSYASQRWVWAKQHSCWQPAADAAAELLPRRRAALRLGPVVRMSFVVSEGAIMALERGMGDPGVAVAQMRHLRDLIDELAPCVRILHVGTRLLSAPGPAFTIVTDRAGRETLFVETLTPNDFMRVRDDRRVSDFARHFAELSDVSGDQSGSRARIGTAIQHCEQILTGLPDAVSPAATDGSRYSWGRSTVRR
ncbi:Scr1 family TA system antitoxin-like transcriptional regulator [Amycolatopsis sp. lyj-112]|uniref:Scr1 family TA system antitoxin-like transcriptional regulator n=1 Tax=Amycolatopsis sp. lyj-112 TaxID=2789288 RepID=UPI00397C39D5